MKLTAKVRTAPELETPEDDLWEWETVNKLLSKPSIINYLRILCSEWHTVEAPIGTDCAIKNLHGRPLYRYKVYKNKTYLLEQYPSPGFPGS